MPTALSIVNKFYPNVKSVKDTTKPIKVQVSKKDCNSKAVKNHSECALALACKREMGLDGVIIAIRAAYLVRGTEAIRCGLGESIAREITAFDRNGTFVPGEYQLLVPSHRLGDPASSGSRKYKKGQGKSKDVYRHITEDIRHIGEKK